jgi:hypothetical protein
LEKNNTKEIITMKKKKDTLPNKKLI